MIYITNIKNVKPGVYDEAYAIVRSFRNQSAWLKQLAALSPSPDLFHKYMALKNAGKWRESSFRDIYVPQFLHEMRYSELSAKILNFLVEKDRAGKNVALCCFCPDETLCHRSIIAGLLQGAGANVRTDTGNDYSRYYQMYLTA